MAKYSKKLRSPVEIRRYIDQIHLPCEDQTPFWYPPNAYDWQRIRPILTRMYQDEKQTLETIISEIRRLYGFRASERMFRRRFEQWGIEKKFKECEVRWILVLEHMSKQSGEGATLLRHGKPVDMEALRRYVRRNGGFRVSEVLDDFSKGNVKPCDWIRYVIPPLESPIPLIAKQYHASEQIRAEWRRMIWATLENDLCFAGETGLCWVYRSDQPNGQISKAFETLLDFEHYSRLSIGRREIMLLRRGCLLLEDVIQCSSFLWWILVVQIMAYLALSGNNLIAGLIQKHIGGLIKVKLNQPQPHVSFLRRLSDISQEELGTLAICLYDILIDVEQQIDLNNTYFSWDSRVSLWLLRRQHGLSGLDREAFGLLQEGFAYHGSEVQNNMAASLIHYTYRNDIDLEAWYRAECEGINVLPTALTYVLNENNSEIGSEIVEPLDFLNLACRYYNDGELHSARECWIHALQMPICKGLALSSANIHYVLEHLDNLSTESEVADGNLLWRQWKMHIENIWQTELELKCADWKTPWNFHKIPNAQKITDVALAQKDEGQ